MLQVDFGLGQFDRFEDHTTIYYRWEVVEDPSSESGQAQAKGLGGSIRPSIENMIKHGRTVRAGRKVAKPLHW
jgi:hypothetical protein